MPVSPFFTIYSCGTNVPANRVGDIGRAMLVQRDEHQDDSLVLHGVGSADTSETINGRVFRHNTPGVSVFDEKGNIIERRRFRRVDGSTLQRSGYILGIGEDENIARSLRAIESRLEALKSEAEQLGKETPVLTINLVGFSRGAKQNIKLTNAAYEQFGLNVRFNVLCIDPVAGPARHNEIDKNVFPSNVDHVYITFSTEEHNRWLLNRGVDNYTFLNENVKVHTCPLPGGHNHQILAYTDMKEQIWAVGKSILKDNKPALSQLKRALHDGIDLHIGNANEEEMIDVLSKAMPSLNTDLVQQIAKTVIYKRMHPSQLETAKIVHAFLTTHGDPDKPVSTLRESLEDPAHRINSILTVQQREGLLRQNAPEQHSENAALNNGEGNGVDANSESDPTSKLALPDLSEDSRVFFCSNYQEEDNPVVRAMNESSAGLLDRSDVKRRPEDTVLQWHNSSSKPQNPLAELSQAIDELDKTVHPRVQQLRIHAFHLLREMVIEHRSIQAKLEGCDDKAKIKQYQNQLASLYDLARSSRDLLREFKPQPELQQGADASWGTTRYVDSLQQKLDSFHRAAAVDTLGNGVKRASVKLLVGVYATAAGLLGLVLCTCALVKRCVSGAESPSLYGVLGAVGLGFRDYFSTAYTRRTEAILDQKKEQACAISDLVTSSFSFFNSQANKPETRNTEETHFTPGTLKPV